MVCKSTRCLFFSLFIVALVAIGLRFLLSNNTVTKLEVPSPGYFGPGQPRPDDTRIVPFSVNFSREAIQELKDRLKSARIGHQALEDVPDWNYGTRLNAIQEWGRHWADNFDFDRMQKELNAYPQFHTQIEGLNIHFVRVRPTRPEVYRQVMPLLLAHGWPGGVYEFYGIFPLLADPKAHGLESDVAFEVVAPAIPGYGFSEASRKKGLNAIATARIFHRLMTERLGHPKYLAQGGDWGSLIVSNLGRMFPDQVLGVHLNMGWVFPFQSVRHFLLSLAGSYFPGLVFSDADHFRDFAIVAPLVEFLQESGYMHIQATKPDTVGIALNDSPLGLMAYLLEKYSTWTNPSFRQLPDGGLLKKFTRDQLLTMVSVYWLQGNIVSTLRFYKENMAAIAGNAQNAFIGVPTAYAAFPYDLAKPVPRELMQLGMNLTQMTMYEDGGHFAAMEQPKVLAKDVLRFAKTLIA